MENIRVTKDYHWLLCNVWFLDFEEGSDGREECDLQGFEGVFAVKFPPRAIAEKRHIHLSNFASYLQGMLSVTNPSVSTNVLGYGAFIGLHANMRYQLLCGFDRDVANHFEVIGVAMLLSTALRSLPLPLLRERSTDDLLKKAYTTGHLRMSWLSTKVPRWLLSKKERFFLLHATFRCCGIHELSSYAINRNQLPNFAACRRDTAWKSSSNSETPKN
ncbi:hypothetical protein WN943_006484 [Citrus x changshan-huyou]